MYKIGETIRFEVKYLSVTGAALTGATEAEMEKTSDLALKLGADTAFSAQEAAGGIAELLKAGMALPDVMNGGADSMLNLAAAGGVDVAKGAEIASVAMNVFKLKGKGLPDLRAYRTGDLVIQILIEIPKRLTKRQRELLEEFAKTQDVSVTPQRMSFLDKMKSLFE